MTHLDFFARALKRHGVAGIGAQVFDRATRTTQARHPLLNGAVALTPPEPDDAGVVAAHQVLAQLCANGAGSAHDHIHTARAESGRTCRLSLAEHELLREPLPPSIGQYVAAKPRDRRPRRFDRPRGIRREVEDADRPRGTFLREHTDEPVNRCERRCGSLLGKDSPRLHRDHGQIEPTRSVTTRQQCLDETETEQSWRVGRLGE